MADATTYDQSWITGTPANAAVLGASTNTTITLNSFTAYETSPVSTDIGTTQLIYEVGTVDATICP